MFLAEALPPCRRVIYGYDIFGNMLTRERTDELFAAPAGFEFDMGSSPMMRNRVVSSMGDYDAGGRMTRVPGNAGAMMSLLWEAMELVPDGESLGATSRMKYTGHARDESAGMDYMLARYLPISSARLMSRDSSRRSEKPRDPQSWDRFTYVRNRPLLSIDPTGLSDTDALQAMRALDDLEVIVGLHEALKEARGTGCRKTLVKLWGVSPNSRRKMVDPLASTSRFTRFVRTPLHTEEEGL